MFVSCFCAATGVLAFILVYICMMLLRGHMNACVYACVHLKNAFVLQFECLPVWSHVYIRFLLLRGYLNACVHACVCLYHV
jgi:hypothetical protein